MIFGDDFSQLQKVAAQVALTLRAVEGAADVRVEQISGLPTLNVAIDHVAAAQYGLTAADVSDALSTGIGGTAAGKIFEAGFVADRYAVGTGDSAVVGRTHHGQRRAEPDQPQQRQPPRGGAGPRAWPRPGWLRG
ncbi:hypothetical protein G6F24_015276 [Rhizopus arrhizus]|nr:hypothetical protein G6F24_015276 [Rhizopus arrhizus]